jgi:hypothetical protein
VLRIASKRSKCADRLAKVERVYPIAARGFYGMAVVLTFTCSEASAERIIFTPAAVFTL